MPVTEFLTLPPPRQQPFARPFIKMQGLRNNFVFLDCRSAPLPSPSDVIRICDVHEGVGAEQVITIEPPRTPGAVAFMGIHNTDGSEAQACGNATRCLAWLLFEETGKPDVLIDSLGGLLHCHKDGAWEVSVTLGPITTAWNQVPLARAVDTAHLPLSSGPLKDGVALSIGNPHAVFFVDCDVDIPAAAPAIARDPLFPESVNVGVARVIDETTLKLAVWERPGMLTEACGTGACVAAYAGRLRGFLKGNDIAVHLPGGTLQIRLLEDGRAVMSGPVAFCCVGFV
ncbi:MAG: diaminopimelate epimerase [Hyphomicrobiales bacterium]|uniref:diaminopimelate epimerase n=1 Tax=Aestuariivirga sp. TaxID=2650926 RepID=UPI0035AE48CD